MRRLLLLIFAMSLAAPAAAASADALIGGNDGEDQVVIYRVLRKFERPFAYSLRAPGGDFGALAPLSLGGHVDDQQVSVDAAGGAVAVWTRGETRENVMVAVRPPGGSFGAPVALATAGEGVEVALAMNARGDALVAWTPLHGAMRYVLRPAGGEFTAPAPLPDSAGAFGPIAAVDDDGGALLVWGSGETVRSAYRPPGGAFQAGQPVAIPESFYPEEVGHAADSSGRLLLAWRDGSAIRALERPPEGSFSAHPLTVAHGVTGDFTGVHSVAIARGGSAVIVWGYSHYSVAARDGTGPWSPPHPLGHLGGYQYGQSAGIDAHGRAAVVWEEPDRELRATYRAPDGVFGAPFTLAPARPFAPGTFGAPTVWVSGSGRATVVWEQSDGDYATAFARDFAASGAAAPPRAIGRARTWHREHPRSACTPRDYRVVRRTKRAVVVVSTRGSDEGSHYACLFARGKLLLLDDRKELYGYRAVALAGPLVANAVDDCGPKTCVTYLTVTDLRDEDDGIEGQASVAPYQAGELASIALKPNGSVAWIGCTSHRRASRGRVRRCVRGGHATKWVFAQRAGDQEPLQLDVGRSIDPTSLHLHGSRLTWRHGKARRHATLR